MNIGNLPATVPNWIAGAESEAVSQETFGKLSPHSGLELCQVARSNQEDVQIAIRAARKAQASLAEITAVQRGDMLYDIKIGIAHV